MRIRQSSLKFIQPLALVSLVPLSLLATGTSKTSISGRVAAQVINEGGRQALIHHPRGMPVVTTAEIIAIRNLGNEHVFRDLEIEVRNNSAQPIYFMDIDLIFPDFVTSDLGGAHSVATSLVYGRIELAKITELATAEDKSLNPGETYVFKISEKHWRAYEKTLAKQHMTESMIKTIRIRIGTVSFGDGTGYKYGSYFSTRRTSMNPPPKREKGDIGQTQLPKAKVSYPLS